MPLAYSPGRLVLAAAVAAMLAGMLGCSPQDPADPAATAASSDAPRAAATTACEFPDARGHQAPDWVCSASLAGAGTTALGSAAKSKAGRAFDRSMALADARSELVEQLAVERSVRDAVALDLIGSRLLATTTSPAGRVYVLVGLDPSRVEK